MSFCANAVGITVRFDGTPMRLIVVYPVHILSGVDFFGFWYARFPTSQTGYTNLNTGDNVMASKEVIVRALTAHQGGGVNLRGRPTLNTPQTKDANGIITFMCLGRKSQ